MATVVEARAVSYAVSPNNEWNDFFLEEGCVLFDGTRPHPAGTPTEPPVVSAVLALAHVWQ